MTEPPIDDDETQAENSADWASTASAPEYIGNFRILQKIGAGGMGEVYEAEQERPVRRKVALKLVKLGMDTRRVLERFELERQVLARLNHPNIASVYDAGATATGRPFFAMEFVKGIPIARFCDTHCLTTRARLELFIQVCDGVQHAHQKGVVHRDIKPTNLLVAYQDDKPVPKIIDFGLAKAIDDRFSEHIARTEIGKVLGTPEYMSPEQADAGTLDIDTRADVYSLGVVLFELLVGSLPVDRESLRGASFAERTKLIREAPLSKPSGHIGTSSDDVAAARNRKTDTTGLRRQLRGDLDWIVMKAMEKDRARRYETAHALARDIQHHLDHEPVQAGPPGAAYRIGKFVKRNRLAVSISAVLLLALIAGAAGTTWQAIRAGQQAAEARTQALRAEQTARFLQEMLGSVDPSVARGRDTELLREILDNAAARVGTELNQQPEVHAAILGTIGRTYRSLALYDEAEVQFVEALAVERLEHGDEHSHVADALGLVASLMWDTGRLAEAEANHREALAIRRATLGDMDPATATSLNNIGLVLWDQSRPEEAEPLLREALVTFRSLADGDTLQIGDAVGNLSLVIRDQGRADEAEDLAREALSIYREVGGNDAPEVAVGINNLARLLADRGALVEAEGLYRESLELRRKLYGAEHPRVARALHNLAAVLKDAGNLEGAESLYRESLDMHRVTLPEGHPNIAWPLTSLGEVLLLLNRADEAEPFLREGLDLRTAALAVGDWRTGHSRSVLGACLLSQTRFASAEPLLLGGYEDLKDSTAAGAKRIRESVERLINLYDAWGRPEQAGSYRELLNAES